MGHDKTRLGLTLALAVLLAGVAVFPPWLLFLVMVSLARGLVVLGLVLQMRAGLVSFGQGLYYCLGGYTAAMLGSLYGIREVAVLIAAAVLVSGAVAIILGIIAGIIAGGLNGFLIVRFNLPPFIVTLGTLSIWTALTLILFKARTIQGPEIPDQLKWLGNTIKIGDFNLLYGVILMLILYVIFGYILRNTAWGTHIYAVGDDPVAAELSGISTKRVIFSVYLVSGLIIGIAGWITIGRVGSASPNVDPLLNLDTITAVVIGGTSLFGGRGTLIGTLLGAFIIVVVENGLSLAGLDQAYRVLAVGILVILAVAVDQWIRKVRA